MAEPVDPPDPLAEEFIRSLMNSVERRVTRAIEPLQSRIAELERRVDELEQGSAQGEAEGGEL